MFTKVDASNTEPVETRSHRIEEALTEAGVDHCRYVIDSMQCLYENGLPTIAEKVCDILIHSPRRVTIIITAD